MSTEDPNTGLTPQQLWLRYQRYPYLLSKFVTFALGAFLVWFVLHSVQNVLFPVFLSLLIAYLLDPFVDRMEERGFSRTRAILVIIGMGVGGIGLFAMFLWPTIADLVQKGSQGIPAALDLIENKLLPWVQTNTGFVVPESLGEFFGTFGTALQDNLPNLLKSTTSGLGDVLSSTSSVVASILNLVMIPIFTFYFLRDFDVMRLAAAEYLPAHNRAWLLTRIQAMDEVVGAWFRGQVEVALILGVLYAVGLTLTFGLAGIGWLPGIAIGLLAGLLNVIPYFGFLAGIALSLLLVVLNWHGIGPLIGVGATFAVVQTLEGYVITPKIVGEKVGLSPVVVIIALLLGGELLGLLGILLALPVAGIIRVLWPDFAEMYRASSFFRGEAGDEAAEAIATPAVTVAAAAEAVAVAAETVAAAVDSVPSGEVAAGAEPPGSDEASPPKQGGPET